RAKSTTPKKHHPPAKSTTRGKAQYRRPADAIRPGGDARAEKPRRRRTPRPVDATPRETPPQGTPRPAGGPGGRAGHYRGCVSSAEPGVTRRPVTDAQARAASRRWWDADADRYQAEAEFLGEVDFVWGPEGLREADA